MTAWPAGSAGALGKAGVVAGLVAGDGGRDVRCRQPPAEAAAAGRRWSTSFCAGSADSAGRRREWRLVELSAVPSVAVADSKTARRLQKDQMTQFLLHLSQTMLHHTTTAFKRTAITNTKHFFGRQASPNCVTLH